MFFICIMFHFIYRFFLLFLKFCFSWTDRDYASCLFAYNMIDLGLTFCFLNPLIGKILTKKTTQKKNINPKKIDRNSNNILIRVTKYICKINFSKYSTVRSFLLFFPFSLQFTKKHRVLSEFE